MGSLRICTLLLAWLSFFSANANFQCARYCKGNSGHFGYKPGYVYKYSYTGSAQSLVNTTTHHVVDQSGVNISCIVGIYPKTNCDYVMEILDVTISDYHIKSLVETPSRSDKFKKLEEQLTKNALYFAFNGKIDTLCPDQDEAQEIIDIKRGILSVFQNTNPLFKENTLVYETDITGNCETHFKVTKQDGGHKLVNKTKNLNACDHRMSNYFSWQTVPYTNVASSKSMPLLKSTLNCGLEYGGLKDNSGDVLLQSNCYEKHVFQPFSNGDNGALTTIQQQLTFLEVKESEKQIPTPHNVQRTTLIYEYKDPNDKMADNDLATSTMTSLTLLKELETKTKDGVDMDVPGVFSRLVFEFQKLTKTHLLEVFKRIDGNKKQKVFFIDAISLITTNSGIEVMSELFGNKKIDEKQMNSWLVSVNFVKNPNKNTVKLIHPLTFHSKIKQNALLALSSVLYKFCSKQNCLDDVVILEIVKNIEKPIGNNCFVTSENDKKEILLALKSIGNAGITSNYYYLQNCYLNNDVPLELRLAAIASHRRMKCVENENMDDFKKLLSNTRANSEIRIASYLAVMQCASYASFAQVKDILMREEGNQLGSFIWTHLTNLQETSLPWKQSIRKLLENEFLQNKFNTDIRKYSRNYETSTFFDSVGIGGGAEANIIFTSESYLPRSAMLNFTLDLFGETINVLELGTRIEGFEDIVENLFTNKDNKNDNDHNLNSNLNNNGVTKQDRINEFGEMFKVLPKQPQGSGYVKIFGNEILYSNFESLKDIFNSGLVLDGKTLNMILQLMKTPDVDYTKSFSILDSTYKVPTILGFPLELKSNATATLGLTAGGEVNVKDIKHHKLLVKGKIYPSVSIQVACTMSLDTYTSKTGIQYLGAVKSNMYIDGYVNIELGKVVDVKINVPKKTMDIFTVTSDLYVVHNDDSYLITQPNLNLMEVETSEYCTDSYSSRLLGLQFCNQWHFINSSALHPYTPNFPLTGSFNYSMHIKKTDVFDYYKLYIETRLGSSDANSKYLIDFVLDTPNSKIDRKLQCTLSADLKEYKVNAIVHSPFVNFQLQSNIESDHNLKDNPPKNPKYKFNLLTKYNDKEVVTLLSTFDVKDEGETVTYEPLAKLNYKQQQIVALTGKLSRVKGGEYTADLKLQGLSNEMAQIYGNFVCGGDNLQIKTNILSKHFKGNLEMALTAKDNAIMAQGGLNYDYNSLQKEQLTFMALYNKNYGDVMNKNTLSVDFQSSEWPRYNTILNWSNQRGVMYFNNIVEVMFFESTWKTNQVIKLNQGLTAESPDVLILCDLQSEENDIDYQSKIQFQMSKTNLKNHILFQLNKIQRIEFLLDYNSKPIEDLKSFNLLVYYAKQTWTLDGVLKQNKTKKGYDFDMACKYNTINKEHVIMTLKGDYKNSSLGEMQNHKLNCTLDLPETNGEWRTPWLITSTVQKSQSTFLSLSKLATKESNYAGHFNWIDDSLTMSIHADDKQLFVLSGMRTQDIVGIVVALNIHQHFELSTKLVMPYQRFDLSVYWDKDRDEKQRFLFFIEQNTFKEQYNMEVEYPNQKICTNILLSKRQVIMNVTWGIEVSQQIYLKMGNKHYEDGGIWFGELETPFRYLEKQQFNLQYTVVTDNFDVQSDLSWRSHNIKLLIAGSISDTHLKGNLQLNTTLPEIRKVGVALSHTHTANAQHNQQIQHNQKYELTYQSDALFDYNEHTIQAESRWSMKADKVDSRFRIDSPTNTIDPIYGVLNLNNFETDQNSDTIDNSSNMNFVLSWQKKNITAMYNFKKDTSSIEIQTPFEGIEKTIIKYSVVTDHNTVYLSSTVDIFKQNNSITLSWTNTDDVATFWLDLMSPMTGGYYVFFTHSVLLGRLHENFQIKGPKNKDLIQMQIQGDIMPLLEINCTASLVILDHNAKFTISNSKDPLVSNILAVWNDRKINSKVQIEFDAHNLKFVNWLVESNLFQPVNISFVRSDHETVTSIILPNDYSLVNKLFDGWNNEFVLKAPGLFLGYDHVSSGNKFKQILTAEVKDKKVECYFEVNSNLTHGFNHNVSGFYKFYESKILIEDFEVISLVNDGFMEEHLEVRLQSTTKQNLNGNLSYQRTKNLNTDKFQAFNVLGRLTCKFPTFCDFEVNAHNQTFSWVDRLTQKTLNVTYNFTSDALNTKLTTTYENIPNGAFWFKFKDLKLDVTGTVNDYNLKLLTDNLGQQTTLELYDLNPKNRKFITWNAKNWKLNSSFEVNDFNGHFSYDITSKNFDLTSKLVTPNNKIEFVSKFFVSNKKSVEGLIKYHFNHDSYESRLVSNDKQLDVVLVTPKDEFVGKVHNYNSGFVRTLDLELSSKKSKNVVTIKKIMNSFTATIVSDYLRLGKQEVSYHIYDFTKWLDFSGEGYYVNGTEKHKFILMLDPKWKNMSLAFYQPDGYLFCNLKFQGRFNSSRDFDASLDGLWDGRKVKFDIKNYFGEYYQTTFNLITPFKNFYRTSLDCTLNDQKIGIALQAKNHYWSLLAGRSGDDMLRLEYMGETLLEMSSSEGHLTLRTTSYLSKYRVFVQLTHTPGIYVFSILKGGENLISFMLQNYSINQILHYKGKLQAPEIIPNNSTFNVEFMANLETWKLFEFKIRKDHKPLLDLGWKTSKTKQGQDLSFKFQSQIDSILNFKLRPVIVISEDKTDIDIEVKYPCVKHGECSFSLVVTPMRLVCNSLASSELLSFNIQGNYLNNAGDVNVDFEFSDFKNTNLAVNLSTKALEHLHLNGICNFNEKSIIGSVNLKQKGLELQLATSSGEEKYYILGKTQLTDQFILLDLHLPDNFTTKANVTLNIQEGFVLITKHQNKYETKWRSNLNTQNSNPRTEFVGHIKQNNDIIGDINFSNTLIKGPTLQNDAQLNITYKKQQFEVMARSILSNNSSQVDFNLKTPWETLKTLNTKLLFELLVDKINFEHSFEVVDKDYSFKALGLTSKHGLVVNLLCKPWDHTNLTNKTLTVNLKADIGRKKMYSFDFDVNSNKYDVKLGYEHDGVTVEVKSNRQSVIFGRFATNLVDFKVNSLGFVSNGVLRLDTKSFILGGHVYGQQQLFFVQNGAFGLVLHTLESNNKTKDNKQLTFIFKTKGSLQSVPILDDYRTHNLLFVFDIFDNFIKLTSDKPKHKTLLDVKLSGHEHFMVNFVEEDLLYKLSTKIQHNPKKSLVVYKDLKQITNDIYIPFNFKVNLTSKLEFTSKHCSFVFSKTKQMINFDFEENKFLFGFKHTNQQGLLVEFSRDGREVYFEVKAQQSIEFRIKEHNIAVFVFEYNLINANNGLVIKLHRVINNKLIVVNLNVKSVQDITFEVMTDQEKSVFLKSLIDNSSISYQFLAPGWTLLKIFDIALSWDNSAKGKIYGAALKLDSEYTGLTEAGTVFEQKQFILNIETFFKAPFLTGLETFYGKVYIPKEFRPHLEFILPNQTYKFYFDHRDSYTETEIICGNQQFSLFLNRTQNFTLILRFPDERFKSLVIKSHKSLEIQYNNEYFLALREDLTYLDVKTPILGYEKFGYLCEKLFTDQSKKFKLVLVHPKYENPLGVVFHIYNKDFEVLNFLYKIHTPFVVGGYDFFVVNMTTHFLPEGLDFDLKLITNNYDLGGEFGLVLSENIKRINGKIMVNDFISIGVVNIEQDTLYFIFGNPTIEDLNFEVSFPQFDRFIPNVQMGYLKIKDIDTFELLIHFEVMSFSLRRYNNAFIQFIRDLRQPHVSYGVNYVPNKQIEVFLGHNHLLALKNFNKTADNLQIEFNNLKFDYLSFYTNISTTQGVYNVSLVKKLLTPLGGFDLTQITSVSDQKLADHIEIQWFMAQNLPLDLKNSSLGSSNVNDIILDYTITSGSLTTKLSSSLLTHPLIASIDMSQFRTVPSKLDAVFIYSNETNKNIHFQMRYNKTFVSDNEKQSTVTDRVFILKHITSKVDYELYFNAIRQDEYSNGSVTLKYKNFDTNKTETILGSVKVDHSKFGVRTELQTTKNRFNLMATSIVGVKRHGFLVHIEINDKDPLHLECNYNVLDNPSLRLVASYGTSRQYVLYAGMPNEKEITARLGHELFGHASIDALVIMKLNTSQLLWTKILWKNNLYSPFYEAILEEYNDLRYVIEAMGKELIDVVHDDVGKSLVKDFGVIKQKILGYAHQNQLKTSKLTNWRRFEVIHDGFWLKLFDTIIETSIKSIKELFDVLDKEIDNAMKNIKNIQHIKVDCKGILKKGINTARLSLKNMESVVVKLLDDFDHYLSSVKFKIEVFFDPFLSLVDDFIVYVEQRLAMLQIAVLDTMDSIQQYIYNLKEIKTMFSVYYSYINWLEELHIIKMLDPVTDVIEEILETIVKDIKHVLDYYKPYLDALGDAIFGKYDAIQQLPPVIEVREHLNRVYHKTIWVWNYHNMTQTLKICIQKFSRDLDNVLTFMEFEEFANLSSIEDLDPKYPFGYNYVFRPENRLIEISQPLPVEWDSFTKPPSFANYPLYQKIQGKSEQFVKFYRSRYDLFDMLENFVVDLYEPSIAPTTLNYAMMIGNTQYTTFNGVNYNFVSNCSYLLASDFKTKSFSLIVNYRNVSGSVSKSYEILSNDSSFEIFNEGYVTLNKEKIDLPVVYKQVTVMREKDTVVAESTRGFRMVCHFHYKYCTVQLSGWLFGKTAGLLGTLDNEQYTDVSTPEKTSLSLEGNHNLEEFLKSWQLDRRTQCGLELAPQFGQANNFVYIAELCDLWFNNTQSPLNKCFSAVDPGLYAQICYNELKANPELKICSPAAAYVHRCKQHKVAIEMPDFCVTCKDDIGYQEEIFDGLNNKTVDVVFITELDCYNQTAVTRTMPKVLDLKLTGKHFVGNRFATVGYGGWTLPKPHVHTHDGNVWSGSEFVQIDSRLAGPNITKTKSKFNAVDAIKYASNLEFRVGVPKLFILTQCEIATDIGNSPDIYNMLGEKDITLHVLKPAPFNSKTQVLGIDLNNVYSHSGLATNNMDFGVNQIINQIDDVYSGLALSTNGTIFDLGQMTTADNGVLWAQALARHIRASPCQKCKCVQDFNGVGKIECSRCLAPAVKQFLNEYEEGNKMQFNDNDGPTDVNDNGDH